MKPEVGLGDVVTGVPGSSVAGVLGSGVGVRGSAGVVTGGVGVVVEGSL